MSVGAHEIFALAESLSVQAVASNNEACRRSCASRAYYAAMHAVMEVIPDDLAPSESEMRVKDSHTVVTDALLKWSNQVRNGRSEARILARSLPKLKHVRKKADYKIESAFDQGEANGALREAAEIMRVAAEAVRKCALPVAGPNS
jgi:uncharacterized protein (UPF0332 family)